MHVAGGTEAGSALIGKERHTSRDHVGQCHERSPGQQDGSLNLRGAIPPSTQLCADAFPVGWAAESVAVCR